MPFVSFGQLDRYSGRISTKTGKSIVGTRNPFLLDHCPIYKGPCAYDNFSFSGEHSLSQRYIDFVMNIDYEGGWWKETSWSYLMV